jgi:hypothetical protein
VTKRLTEAGAHSLARSTPTRSESSARSSR